MLNSFESNLIKIPAKEVVDELYGKPPSKGEQNIAEFRKKKIEKPPTLESEKSGKEFLEQFEQKSLDFIERLLEDKGEVNAESFMLGLAGLDSDRAWKLRENLLEKITDDNKRFATIGLAGLDSDRAWEMRERFLADGIDKGLIARSLVGESIVWRKKYEDRENN